MTPKILGEIIILAITIPPFYVWFFRLWFGNIKKVWKNNKVAALLPAIIPIGGLFTLWVFFFL